MKGLGNIFINQLNNKEISAYKQLYHDFYKILVLFAMEIVEEEESAKDIVQELIISMWEKELHFDNLNALKSFLYNAVRNSCLNYLRHTKVEENYSQKVLKNVEPSFDLQKEIEKMEIYRMVFEAVDKLPDKCKEVFELYLKGKKNAEIAEILQLSIETVKTQKKRAIKKLKDQLGSVAFSVLFLSLCNIID